MAGRVALLLLLCVATACRTTPPAGRSKELTRAAEVCASGDAGVCGKLAGDLDTMCASGDGTACRDLAVLHLTGRLGRVDYAKAIAFYEKACAARDGESCREAAVTMPESARGEQLLQTGCDNSDGHSCSELVAQLRTAARDLARADVLFRRAVTLFEKGCDADDPDACIGLGGMYTRFAPPDEAKASVYYRKALAKLQPACQSGDAAACYKVGVAYHDGAGVETDFARHLGFMERACALGNLKGCAETAAGYKTTETLDDDPKAPALFEKACRGGVLHRQPCRDGGFLFVDGTGVPVDKAKGADLLERGCAMRDVQSCVMVGGMYLDGNGVPADATKAAGFLKSLSGLSIKVVSVKRTKEADDPAALQMGVSPSEMPRVKAGPGQDLIIVAFDVRRTAPDGLMPIRTVWVLDKAGQAYPGVLRNDFAFGQSPEYQREMVFKVPAGMQPVKVKFELGALSLDLPPAKKG